MQTVIITQTAMIRQLLTNNGIYWDNSNDPYSLVETTTYLTKHGSHPRIFSPDGEPIILCLTSTLRHEYDIADPDALGNMLGTIYLWMKGIVKYL